MDALSFTNVVNRLRNASPFQPFTIRLNDGSHFEVDDPNVIAAHEGSALGWLPGKVPIWFDHDAVSRIVEDIAANTTGSAGTESKA